jgi:hypothetical protein
MKLTAKDFASLKIPLVALAISIAAGIALVQFSSAKRAQAEAQNRRESVALQEARSRYHRSGEEREMILRNLPAYRQLEEQGLVGTEQRINWLEGLRNANSQAGLFGVTYQLQAQKQFSLLGEGNPIAQHVHHSQMKLSFGLVHEGDLMRFFRALAAQKVGVFVLTGCALDRAGRADAPVPRQANLNAQCELSWLTVHPPENK